MFSISLTLVFSLFFDSAALGATYYISPVGNDANDGLSKEKPWKTIDKVNSSNFRAGDAILFKGSSSFP
ncbi:MAG: right-handed parallel beta-helix repeat-containing protein, partial [Bdellovibrionota bacterium]